MTLSDDEIQMAIRITKRMMSKGVADKHHKQKQTIAGWFATHERGEVKDVLNDMISDTEAPVRQKGRGTVTLISIQRAKQFLEDNGAEDPRGW